MLGTPVEYLKSSLHAPDIAPEPTTIIKHTQDEKKRKCSFVFVQEMSMKVQKRMRNSILVCDPESMQRQSEFRIVVIMKRERKVEEKSKEM